MKTDIQTLENSQIKITVTIPVKDIETHRDDVEKEVYNNLEVDGFRKGKVPKDIAKKHISSLRVWEEMAHKAISKSYVDIIHKESIKAIGHPEIMITKIAEGSDLECTITTAVLPNIKLGNYKKIATEENKKGYSNEVPETEVDEAILNLRKMRVQQEQAQNTKEGENPLSWKDITDDMLPEVTDEWVKTLGDFANVDDFKSKMRENIVQEKDAKNFEKRRITMIESILKDSSIPVPDVLVEYELDKMMHELEGNIAMSGMVFDEYLKHIGKTKDDYRAEMREKAKERAQVELMLNDIARQENIEVDDKDIETEVKRIMEQYKHQQGIDENNVRAYVANILSHQKVFAFLDEQK